MKSFCTLKFIRKILFQKKLYLYGAASSGVKAALLLQSLGFNKKNLYFIDSNCKKVGKIIYGIKVLPLDLVNKSSCVIITSSMFYEIEKTLKKKKFTNFYYFHDLIWKNFLEEKFTNNFINIYKKIKKNIYLSIDEAFTLYDNLTRILNIETKLAGKKMGGRRSQGHIAEVGVYKGGSAFLLCELIKNTKKNIYLFDTFEGLPEDTKKNKEFTPSKGWLANTNLEKVKKFLLKTNINSKKLKIIKGIFPSTLNKEIKKEKFSLVHLDTDLFQSTYDGLNFFYPRLIKYGCIISHDYSSFGCPGVKMAFDEFVSENRIEHKLLQISQSQVLLLK
jgi:hypothetical protein